MATIKSQVINGDSAVGKDYMGIGNPFFDNSNIYLPQNREEMLGISEYFYMYNSILRGTINKLATYPLTELQLDSVEDPKVKAKWGDILNEYINVREICKQSGINTFTYGEAFIIPHIPKKRMYKCSSCGDVVDTISNLSKREWKVRFPNGKSEPAEHSFHASCIKCRKKVEFTIKDTSFKDPRAAHIRFLNIHPKYFQVKMNMYTGDSVYYMNVDPDLKKSIRDYDPDYFDTMPLLFIKATFEKTNIRINKNNVYHLKNVGLTSSVMPEHGESSAMSTFKDLFFSQMLKHTQEIIAKDRTVGYRGVSPGDQSSMMTDLSGTKKHVENEIKEWRKDPNHVAWFPSPVKFSNFSGEAKNLFLSGEIKSANDFAIVGLEVPQNFVYGNVGSYSGGSVDLRMLENRFISYVSQLNRMIREFIIPKCAAYYKLEKKGGPERIRFQKFKMADDVQHKQLLVNLALQNKLSMKTLLDNIDSGLDYETEIKALQEEARHMAEIQGDAGMLNAEYQAKAQAKAMIMQMEAQNRVQTGVPENTSMFDGEQFSRIPLVENAVDKIKAEIDKVGPGAIPYVLQMEQQFPNVVSRLYDKYPAILEVISQAKLSMQPSVPQGIEPTQEDIAGSETAGATVPIEANNPPEKPPTRQGGSPM